MPFPVLKNDCYTSLLYVFDKLFCKTFACATLRVHAERKESGRSQGKHRALTARRRRICQFWRYRYNSRLGMGFIWIPFEIEEAQELNIGDRLDLKDTVDRWLPAKVISRDGKKVSLFTSTLKFTNEVYTFRIKWSTMSTYYYEFFETLWFFSKSRVVVRPFRTFIYYFLIRSQNMDILQVKKSPETWI